MFQQARTHRYLVLALVALPILAGEGARSAEDAAAVKNRLDKVGARRGLCVVLGDQSAMAVDLARKTELTIFVQSPSEKEVSELRQKADAAGLLGTRIYVQKAVYRRLNLADDMADVILVGKAANAVPKAE